MCGILGESARGMRERVYVRVGVIGFQQMNILLNVPSCIYIYTLLPTGIAHRSNTPSYEQPRL